MNELNNLEQNSTTVETQDFTMDDIYFKDAFTQTEDKLNLEVNHITADCLTSKNNKFSLDSEGNLVVNTITANQREDISFNMVYPVGSIYLSVNDTNPSTLFGGIWEQIKDKFLLGAGDSYASGTTGGQANHRHLAENMKAMIGSEEGLANTLNFVATECRNPNDGSTQNGTYSITGASMRNSRPFSHWTPVVGYSTESSSMPPYLTVYMWKRIA